MRAVLLASGQGNQRALANKLARVVDLVGVVVSENVPGRKKPPFERAELLVRRAEVRLLGRPFVDAWFEMLRRYDEQHPRLPPTRVIRVSNVNDPRTLAFLDECEPDVVLVSGTNLVGRAIVDRANRRLGILNLHTGISPYVKGGPNCTNWCLAKGWYHLIGSTMMWLDAGIDSGDVICTERTPLDGTESLDELHFKVIEHGHAIYVRSVEILAAGRALPRIKQDAIAPGTTFYTREWNAAAILRARANFARRFRSAFESGEVPSNAARVKLVGLPTQPPRVARSGSTASTGSDDS